MKTVGVIQARMGASRLPNKMMLSLHGKPIIDWVVSRSKKAKLLDSLIVALPDTKENDIIENYLKSININCFRGSESDVLNRMYHAAKEINADQVVRICADNPLISPKEIDNLIRFFANQNCDYAYNHIPKNNTYPDGLGAEILSFKLLEHAEQNAVNPSHREHCCLYITENTEKYNILTFEPENKILSRPDLKFDIDTFEDYYYLCSKFFNQEIEDEELIKLFG